MRAAPSCEILPQTKGPFTLSANVFLGVFDNGSKKQRMGSVPILSVNVHIDVSVDGKCERTLTKVT